jgi:dTDP-4-dehydrorhamnose 3,5-epimerase
MRVERLAIPDVMLVHLDRHPDARGVFAETYERSAFAALGIDAAFVQDSLSISARRGTVRGLHFQAPPQAQAKLVRVARGRIFDVAVDLRRSSPTFGRHVAVEMAAGDWRQLFVPAGFAHGFCTLADDTEVAYKMDARYDAACAKGILWRDPDLGIRWPVAEADAVLSDQDRRHPPFKDLPPAFP